MLRGFDFYNPFEFKYTSNKLMLYGSDHTGEETHFAGRLVVAR